MNKEILMEREKTQKFIEDIEKSDKGEIDGLLLDEDFEERIKKVVENSVSSILEHTAEDGKKYETKFYNLDAIISVGYRVNFAQATKFRI